MITLNNIQAALKEVQEFSNDPSLSIQVEGGKARLVRVLNRPDGKSFVLDVCAWKTIEEFTDYMAELVAHARRKSN